MYAVQAEWSLVNQADWANYSQLGTIGVAVVRVLRHVRRCDETLVQVCDRRV